MTEYEKYFKNNIIIFPIIKKNENIPIKSINGKNPFDFISEFGNNYLDFRSPHASFIIKYYLYNNGLFDILPLTYEELTNFTVVYDNNKSFTTDYLILSKIDIYNAQLKNPTFKNANINRIKKYYYLDLKEIKREINKINKLIINEGYKTFENIPNENIINWDYNYEDIFKCRIDNINKINVYYISSFI